MSLEKTATDETAKKEVIRQEVYGLVIDFCGTVYPPVHVSKDDFNPRQRLLDLGLDSHHSADLIFETEERFKVNLHQLYAEDGENLTAIERITPLEIADLISELTTSLK